MSNQHTNAVPSYDDMPLPIRTEHNFIKILLDWITVWQAELAKNKLAEIIKIKDMITVPTNMENSSSLVYSTGYNKALTEVIDLLESGEEDDIMMNQGNDYPS